MRRRQPLASRLGRCALPATHSASRISYSFDLATPDDDAALRALLREIALPGAVRLSAEHEPGTFAADAASGETVQTLVARPHPGGPAVALASRTVRTVLVGGEPTRVGYLGGLRVHPAHRGRALVARGWSALRELHRADPVPFYTLAVTAENGRAQRLLTLGRGDAPTVRPLADLVTAALVVHRFSWGAPAAPEAVPPNAEPRDLFPAAPHTFPGLSVSLAVPGARGVLWDPRAVRRTVVRGYSGALGRARPLANVALRALGAPPLPAPGEALRSAFLARPEAESGPAYDALLGAALAEARRQRLAFVLVGHDAADPYLRLARRRLHVPYRSTLFAAHWPDGAPPRLRRPLHAEIATY